MFRCMFIAMFKIEYYFTAAFDHVCEKPFVKSVMSFGTILLCTTGSNMRWKLNFFKRCSLTRGLNQASVLLRTHCSRLFTRDHDVTMVREYSVTLSNLFTPRRASRFDYSCGSLCNQYRAFSMVSNTTFELLVTEAN